MNLVAQFNFFWQKHPEYAFKPLEIAVYSYLLNFSNGLGRKNPFNLAKERLMFEMGVRTEDALDVARKRLREAGLIQFENGFGRGRTTLYTLLPPPKSAAAEDARKEDEKGSKNPPFSDGTEQSEKEGEKGPENPPFSEGQESEKGEQKGVKNAPNKGGTTLKKRKDNSTCAKSENDEAPKPIPFGLFWDAYDKKNGKKVASQKWAALTPEDQAAALAHVPLYRAATPDKQYRKDPATYLHNRTWEDEELPPLRSGQRPALAPVVEQPAPAPAPEMNAEFLAQQAQEAEARRAARIAQLTATAAA